MRLTYCYCKWLRGWDDGKIYDFSGWTAPSYTHQEVSTHGSSPSCPRCSQSLAMQQQQPEMRCPRWARCNVLRKPRVSARGKRGRSDVTLQNAGSCQRRLLQQVCSTSYRMEWERQRLQERRTCIYLILLSVNKTLDVFHPRELQIHRAVVAVTTGSLKFAWRVKSNTADASMQIRVFTDNKAVARKQFQQNAL